MVEELEPLVGGQGGGEPGAGRPGQLGGGLLAEAAEQVAGPFQIAPGGRVGVGQQAHDQADHDRVDAGVQDRDPGRDPQQRVDDSIADPGAAQHQDYREHPGRHGQRDQADVRAVDGPDDDQGYQVIHHRHRQQERTDPVREPGPGQGQHPQRERGVGRHRCAPAPRRRPVIERQVDPDRDDQATQPGQHRQCQPLPLPQLTHVELAAGLQPEDKEKERHQPAVHPLAQVQRHPSAREPHRQPRPPHRLIRRRADVDPHQRRHRHRDQHRGAPGLRAQEHPQRRLQASRPRGTARQSASRRRRAILGHGFLLVAWTGGAGTSRDRKYGVA